ncbi:MAG: cyclic nucleotide-binding domain-containing protein [Verrucomicrobia bacterium]|nr:cyclic nucleotide-binding domain-containing protein [Verrucomicrobiota bacterium]
MALRRIPKDTRTRILLLAAQSLALLALVLGLIFTLHTTGGTLFLFSSLAPVLVGLAIVILAAVAVNRYLARHRLFEIEDYEPGDIVFREGDPGDCAYFIHSGEVEVIRELNGLPQVIDRMGKDDYFGETALLTNARRNATIRAASKLRVAVLGKANFQALLSVLPATKQDMLKTVQARAMAAVTRTPSN